MSRTIPSGLNTHLQGGVLTIASLWKLTLLDATVFGYTSSVRDIVYDAVTYEAARGLSATALKIGLGTGIDNFDVSILFTNSGITESDLRRGALNKATLDLYVLNYKSVASGAAHMYRGRIGNISVRDGEATCECRGLMQHARQQVGKITSPLCGWEFGGTECAFAVTDTTGAVTSRTSDRVFRDSGLIGDGDDFYAYGIIEFTSGDNAGARGTVKKFTSATGEIELQLAMPYTVAVSDDFTISQGCNRLWSTCKALGNQARFGGEPHVPGIDAVLRRPPS